jgi:emfourin
LTGSPTPASLYIERSGGFGGLTLHTSVPLVELSNEERVAVERCFRLPNAPPSGPDRFVYRLRLGDREAVVQEDKVPPVLQPLLSGLSRSWH